MLTKERLKVREWFAKKARDLESKNKTPACEHGEQIKFVDCEKCLAEAKKSKRKKKWFH